MPDAPVKSGRPPRSALGKLVRHPLFLLLLGTLLGSVFIPYVNSQAAHSKAIEELRTQKALAALQANYEVDRQLNVLLTTFGTFWSETDETNRKSRRPELRAQVYKQYEQFDRSAWWWFDEAWQGAEILDLLEAKEVEKVKALSDEYRNSLLECTAALDLVWKMSLRQDPLPLYEEAEKALQKARTTINNSRTKRLQIVGNFTRMLRSGSHLYSQTGTPSPQHRA